MKETFIQQLTRHITENYDLKRQALTIVFPNKRAAFYLREAFKDIVEGNIWLPQMLSIEEAVSQWSGISLADNTDLMFELIGIYARLHPEKRHDESDLRIFGGQAAQMAKDFDEIDQYDVNAKDLFGLVNADKELQIWDFDEEKRLEKEKKYLDFFRSLIKYYDKLHEQLEANNKGYYGMVTRHLAHLEDEKLAQSIGEQTVIFAGFNALTRTEEAIIDKLVKMGKAEIIFDYDTYYINDETNEAGFFGRHYLANHPNWIRSEMVDRLQNGHKNIHLVAATGNAIQAKALQSKLQALGKQDMAIVLADEKLLIPVLNAIPDHAAYAEMKVSMGYPMNLTAVHLFINEYLALQKCKRIRRTITQNGERKAIEGWYLWPVLRFMSLELVRTILTREESLAFGQWKKNALEKGTFILEETSLEELISQPHLYDFLKLLTLTNDTPADTVASLRKLLQFASQKILSFDRQRELLFLLNQISESGKIVNRLEQILKQYGDFVTDKESLEILYRLVTKEASIKLNCNNTEGLQIMGLLETRNLDFETIHVLSVNEGILPAEKSQSSFIPSSIKAAYKLPGYREKQAVFAYHFYHLLQNASEIYLYYNNASDKSGGEPSRFVLQIVEELARKNKGIQIIDEPFAGQKAQPSDNPPLYAPKKGVVTNRILKKACESGLSPTAISTYLHCPMRFFMKYVQNIKDENVDEDTGVNITGTIIHDAFKRLFEAYAKQEISAALFQRNIKPEAEHALALAIEDTLPSGLSDVGYNYLDKLLLKKWLHAYMDYTERCLKAGDITILKTEEKLETQLKAGNALCTIFGYADRIDQYNGLTRIIDYKSGNVTDKDITLPIRIEGESHIEYLKRIPEKALQLLIYKYLYIKNNPQAKPNQVAAALHCLRYPKRMEYTLHSEKQSASNPCTTFLNDANFVAEMESMLTALIEELFDTETPFLQCEKGARVCSYCDFSKICKRD